MSEKLQSDLSEIELPKILIDEVEKISKELKLSEEKKEKVLEEVKKIFLKSMFEPGEAIGIIAAQSISEPATQMTMRTYHFAGSAGIKVTYGLPRLVEIFDAKKELETPVMEIYLKKEFNNMEKARELAEDIIERRISNVVKRVAINLSENVIEIEVDDLRKLGKVIKIIKENFPEVRVKEKAKSIVVRPKEEVSIKELQVLREKILDLHFGGIKGIKNAIVRREGEDWLINTLGSNLEEVLKMEEVDETRTITNNIYETFKVLGIEAARNVIVKEAMKTLEEQGLNVDIRHIFLVGDIMTSTGRIQSIGRYGVAGSQTSILARAAFEETVKHLVRASIRNEVDEFKGIFENVMIGQVIPSGTGMPELIAKFEEEGKK
ncbi:MAG: DNA-directed RNA polymerase subunit A'' [Candidatus Aenigmatarchaeota archaeon]